jgi:TatD DNase family protein
VELFDGHAHLCAPEFAHDLDAVLARAEAAGVRGVLAVGETLEDAERNLRLAEQYPLVKPAAGLYPTILDPGAATALEAFIRREAPRLAAIGEVGLDRWKVKGEADWRLQEEIFGRFVRLAAELELPLNIHSRAAGRRALALLQEGGARRVLMHAFDGKVSTALAGVRAGYYFSVPPSLVRSPQKQKLVRGLPLEALILETDAPVLGPDPSARNEPEAVGLVCHEIARLKGVPEEAVARITTENARRLFPRAFVPDGSRPGS